MIQFNRYPHINDLVSYYIAKVNDKKISEIYENGLKNEIEAEIFCKFIWLLVEHVHADEEAGNSVLGSVDNTEMLPDLSYEITNYMRKTGYYDVWSRVSENS
jgi:hypothetical protein